MFLISRRQTLHSTHPFHLQDENLYQWINFVTVTQALNDHEIGSLCIGGHCCTPDGHLFLARELLSQES